MLKRQFGIVVLAISLAAASLCSFAVPSYAKSLSGTPCTKIGMVMGDGPSKSIICQQAGKKKLWQPLTQLPQGNSTSSTGSSGTSPAGGIQKCLKAPEFTANFIDPKYVRDVTPIGEQTGAGGVIAVRSYVHPSQTYLGQQLPIYAPVNMTLYSANYYKLAGASATYKPEYSLYFDAGCGITVRFFHIKGVVGKVASVVPTVPSTSSAGEGVKSVSVKAGEQIGWYQLGENSVAFDFWVDNATALNNFIVQSHFASSNALHSVCPYNFYSADKKAIWLAKLGSPGSDPVPGTTCGSISEGISGTAQGMWFISANTITDQLTYDGPYQSQIMFTTDAIKTIRIGGLNASGTPSQMMVSSDMPTWKNPSDVKIGDTQCWSTAQQSVKVHVISNKAMSVLVGAGDCASLGDPASGRTYVR